MNYQAVYDSLINRRRKIPADKGEVHHIIPKWRWLGHGKRGDLVGDKDDPSNLVKLTYREHFIAHRLLAKMSPPKFVSSAYGAVMLMLSTVERIDRTNSRKYASARAEAIRRLSRPDVNESTILETLANEARAGNLQLVDDVYLTVKEVTRIGREVMFFTTAAQRVPSFYRLAKQLSELLGRDVAYDEHYRSEEQRDHARSIMKDRIWVTDIRTGCYLPICAAQFNSAFHLRGRIGVKSVRGMILVHKGDAQRAVLPEEAVSLLDSGWLLGGRPREAATSGYVKVSIDGVRQFVPYEVAKKAWLEGRATSKRGNYLGRMGDDYVMFESLLELRMSGYELAKKGTGRAERVVMHHGGRSVMVEEPMVPSLIDCGWKIGRPGAKKRSRANRIKAS